MRTTPNTCKRGCCWTPQSICAQGRGCRCHLKERIAEWEVNRANTIRALPHPGRLPAPATPNPRS